MEEGQFFSAAEARSYFLREENYFTVPLPKYFKFGNVLGVVEKKMRGKTLSDFCNLEELGKAKGVNFCLYGRKDGEYGVRKFQAIHPAIYVELLRLVEENWGRIVERAGLFRRQEIVSAVGARVTSERDATAAAILRWWNGIEQNAIKMSLYYDYVAKTDVMACYDSFDIGLIREAIGGKGGEEIARVLSLMSEGKMVGIPQGCLLVDLLAEIGFLYLDALLWAKLKKCGLGKEFAVVRFRDDYRIYANDEKVVREILTRLAGVLARFGMRLNPEKTEISDDIVGTARKADKIYWEDCRRQVLLMDATWGGVQKSLLLIYELQKRYPNSGSVQRALVELYEKRIVRMEKRPGDAEQILGIMVNIMARNPRASQICVAIMSKILSFNPGVSRRELANYVLRKVKKYPNLDYFEEWLQRLTVQNRPEKKYGFGLCRLVNEPSLVRIWNSEWLDFEIDESGILDKQTIKEMDFVMPVEEIQVFSDYSDGGGEFVEFGI